MGTGPCPLRPLGTIPLIPWPQVVSSNDCAQYLRETLWRLPRFSLCPSFFKYHLHCFPWALSSISSTQIVWWALPGFSLPVSGLETLKPGKWGDLEPHLIYFLSLWDHCALLTDIHFFFKPLFHVFHFPPFLILDCFEILFLLEANVPFLAFKDAVSLSYGHHSF